MLRERGEREGRLGGEIKEGKGRYKVAFWNVAGVRNKDQEFWKGLEEWEVVVMTETWVEEREWEYVRARLPKDYEWEKQWARRENKKGRAIGGMIMGVRRGIEIGQGKEGRGRGNDEEGEIGGGNGGEL